MSETFLARKSPQLAASGSTLTSSMYRDLTEQAPVEADTILRDLVERGRKRGVSAPLVQAAFVSLTIYQQGRARAKAAGR
jgi:2-dehydropantoate 2-reductase